MAIYVESIVFSYNLYILFIFIKDELILDSTESWA